MLTYEIQKWKIYQIIPYLVVSRISRKNFSQTFGQTRKIYKIIHISGVRNPCVKLTIENWLVKRGCPRVYKHMVKLTRSPISYFNLASRSPPSGFDHKATIHLIPYLMSYTRLLGVMVG